MKEGKTVNKVLCFGSMNIDYVYMVDHFVKNGETIASSDVKLFTGGKGLNQSVALARAGIIPEQAGAIGADGEFLLRFLVDCGADTSKVEILDDVRTGCAIIQNDSEGDNCIILYGGANRAITTDYVDYVLSGYSEGDYILLQNEINNLPYIIEKAHELGMKVVLNPSPMDKSLAIIPSDRIDLIILNQIEAEQLCEMAGISEVSAIPAGLSDSELLAFKVRSHYDNAIVVLTLGSDGSTAYDGSMFYRQMAYAANPVDTTGAGDTFTGYFLASFISGDTVGESLKKASAAASIAVTRYGAAASIPCFEEVEEILKA